VLQGQKVLPKELLREGYRFEYETITDALNEIVNE
jgi:NAD dependent epimerase/dehydratase family enzyme